MTVRCHCGVRAARYFRTDPENGSFSRIITSLNNRAVHAFCKRHGRGLHESYATITKNEYVAALVVES